MKPGQISAKAIHQTIDRWRQFLWPSWNLERKIEDYANGGPPPMDGADDPCENEVVPLGFANTYMRKQMDALLDPLAMEPGIINASWVKGKEDKTRVEIVVNKELNQIVMERMEGPITAAAGRATVTGRSFLYRKSPTDWVLKSGRLIHHRDAGIDPMDDTFREWAFSEQIRIRDLDEMIKRASSDNSGTGWDKNGLLNLKEWILAAEASKNIDGAAANWLGNSDESGWMDADLRTEAIGDDPVEVYWYFRKNGKKVTMANDPTGRFVGHEYVDVYCISRFGTLSSIAEKVIDIHNVNRSLHIQDTTDQIKATIKEYRQKSNRMVDTQNTEYLENERLLYFYRDRFMSVNDTLVVHIDDARVSGDQTLSEVRGSGKASMPKLAVMESLLTALFEGLTFAAQPHWSMTGGIAENDRKILERGSINSYQVLPAAIQPMGKQNALTGFGHAMSAIKMLDVSSAADSASSNEPVFGGGDVQFAAQANSAAEDKRQSAGRRLSKWLKTLDKVADIIGRTLCLSNRPEVHACYHDMTRLRHMLEQEDITAKQWDCAGWKYTARRLAGEMQRKEAAAKGLQMIQFLGPVFPGIIPVLGTEVLRATYGDTWTVAVLNPPEKEKKDDMADAFEAVTVAFVTGHPPEAEDMADPSTHAQIALAMTQSKLQGASQAGIVTPGEQLGIAAVIQYGASMAGRLPKQVGQPILDQFKQFMQVAQKIPVQNAVDAEQQRKEKELEIKKENLDRLAAMNEKNHQLKQANLMLQMRKQGEQEDMNAETKKGMEVQRAQGYQGLAMAEQEASQPDTPAFP